ncbi:diguanylate cyclase (GGDEF)-like protein [Yoonia maritima]|uniref:diguanylate cyclase n=1 Tax=Yoonia maritima TaxID=1435347 RepID=A0A2T0W185_9RHOB|nr:GGDEF domain-containing protein [Yoonia maritima]PRY78771.1 diguanylate cyclase (GGDEF)-like protein [Yoonia maritima]
MFHPQVINTLAPNSVLGWVLRMPIFAAVFIGLTMSQRVLLGKIGLETYAQAVLVSVFGVLFGTFFVVVLRKVKSLQSKVQAVGSADPLTGVWNRKAFCEAAGRLVSQNGVLLVLDIDHLGAMNSNHGRGAGGVCLMALAQRCRELTRETDVVGRLDGASIAIYLPGVPAEIAREIADRLKDGIQVCSGGQILEATISVGAVVVRGKPSIETLLRFAERALDRAKSEGRARVIMRGWPKAA